jgi:hypothetical protein
MWILPGISTVHDQEAVSERHSDLLEKDVLTFEEADELTQLSKQTPNISASSMHEQLRYQALVISWAPWFLFGLVYRWQQYKDVIWIVPAVIFFWVAGFFVGLEVVVFIGATLAGDVIRNFLSQKKRE